MESGMTDMQFDAFIHMLLDPLEKAKSSIEQDRKQEALKTLDTLIGSLKASVDYKSLSKGK